jgi:hypothetical protein
MHNCAETKLYGCCSVQCWLRRATFCIHTANLDLRQVSGLHMPAAAGQQPEQHRIAVVQSAVDLQ